MRIMNPSNAPSLHIMVGPPASGKSTAAQRILESLGPRAMIICPDTIRGWLSGDEGCQAVSREAFQIARTLLENRLLYGVPTVWDATNCNLRSLQELLTPLPTNANVCLHCAPLSLTLEVLLRRNASRARKVPEDVVRRMWETYLGQVRPFIESELKGAHWNEF